MRVVNDNCKHSDAICMNALEEAKTIEEYIVYIQDQYVSGDLLFYPVFERRYGTLYKRRKQRVAIGIVVSIRVMLIAKVKIDIIDHHYIMVLNSRKLDGQGGKKKSSTRIIISNDNNVSMDLV